MADTHDTLPLPEPFAWRYGSSFWEKLESIPAAIRPGAVPLYSQEDMTRLRAEVKAQRDACATAAWTHYMDVCKARGLAPSEHEHWNSARAVRGA